MLRSMEPSEELEHVGFSELTLIDICCANKFPSVHKESVRKISNKVNTCWIRGPEVGLGMGVLD